MKNYKKVELYGAIMGIVIVLDRLTKFFVLRYLESEQQLTSFLSLDLIVNRGISWGMFHSTNEAMFYLITTLVIGVIAFLASHTYARWSDGYFIGGEVLILAGSLSNLIDRFLYRGVIDFIILSWDGYTWPAFNVADMAIVIGIAVMVISVYAHNDD